MSRALLAFPFVSLVSVACVAFRDDGGGPTAPAEAPVDVGSHLELFVDDVLIDELEGARVRLHHPRYEGEALAFYHPWEGRFSGYVTVLRDTDRFRMYYRGLPSAGADGSSVESTCYAESKDGLVWMKPHLGLFEVNGSKSNNIVLKGFAPASHNFSPFIDRNPAAEPSARYKALGGAGPGLLAFASPDGIRWRQIADEPVITKGAFDSQNVPFWSESEGVYVCYFRTWTGPGAWGGYRSVSRTTSKDFLEWDEPQEMSFGDTPWEHLYTNQTHPYYRAPHIYLAVAARFWPGRRVLSAEEARAIDVDPGYFGDISDAVLLSSRGGTRYSRMFLESFIRPGQGVENWVSRTNYPALGILPTGDGRVSIWVQKNYGQPTARIDRYSLRVDGFVSVNGSYAGGELRTKPLVFSAAPEEETEARRGKWRESSAKASPVGREGDGALDGSHSLRFRSPATIELPGTQELGRAFTLSAHLRDIPPGHRRLFSAYDGGSTAPGELIFDFNSGGAIDNDESIRFFWNGKRVGAKLEDVGSWNDGKTHHLALTWRDGVAAIYFDGKKVGGGGEEKTEEVSLRLGNLLLGEDYAPTDRENEPLLGLVDDVLVLSRALSAEEIAALAERGATAIQASATAGVLLSMEGDDGGRLDNSLGGEDASLPPGSAFPVQELVLNYATSAAGSVRVEIQDASGVPIPGFRLEDSRELIGDWIERPAVWAGGTDVSRLRGKPIRLRFVLRDADLYAIRFR